MTKESLPTSVVFRMIGYIMKLASIGAFGAMAYTVGAYGATTLSSFGLLIAC
ncbi:cation:dicarboxylate symporter family transporter [Paenibacillus pabuli]|uniref:cation:dicarboxylate symporter family transporter n=1 Tax=Paenibacillus pabuli TaxID=1472 RepID=UPI003CF3690D